MPLTVKNESTAWQL